MILYKDEIRLSRTLMFLCGSNYQGNKSDKRKILLNYLYDLEQESKPYALIIDGFLSRDNIEDEELSIEVFEELISAVSFLNVLFLESFSSASELGLFTGLSSSTKTIVFYPRNDNLILDKIGAFIKEGIFRGKRNGVVEAFSYNALVERYAHGTDFIDEYYYFENNSLPNDVREHIDNNLREVFDREYAFRLVEGSVSQKLDFMTFSVVSGTIRMSAKTFFYSLYALLVGEKSLSDLASLSVDQNMPSNYCERILEAIKNTASANKYEKPLDNAELAVENFENVEIAAKYSLFFIKYLTLFASKEKRSKGKLPFLCKFKDMFQRVDTYAKKEKGIFDFPKNTNRIIPKYSNIRRFTIWKNHKSRKITAYREGEKNNPLREYHRQFSNLMGKYIEENGVFSDCSCAYRNGRNTIQCVQRHLGSVHFLKLDIKSFFDSMTTSAAHDAIIHIFQKNPKFKELNEDETKRFSDKITRAIYNLTLNGSFPIGFISSPLISNIYLTEFDSTISEYCGRMGVVYTRYADDLLFSSPHAFNREELMGVVNDKLADVNLFINDGKTVIKDLMKNGDYINYLGLYITKKKGSTFVTVGKSLLKRLAKEKVFDESGPYHDKRIKGMEHYIKHVSLTDYSRYLDLVQRYSSSKK